MELRAQLSIDYGGIDLRSKSDAQIAEAVIMSEVVKRVGKMPKRPKIETGTIYRYTLLDHIRFKDPELNKMLFEVANAPFEIGLSKKEGQIVLSPKELEGRIVKIGNTEYRLGIGGIHSTEKSISHIADESTLLIDRDVESYYPRLILNQNLYPEQVGPVFLEIFDTIVESRLHDKHVGNKVGADSKKIIVNSTYGKLNDNWSRLRSPRDMIQVTLTGQLSILVLIELAELNGIPAISANTDGVVFKCPVVKYDLLNQIIKYWEGITNFVTEETRYKAVYSANVNNYLAVKTDGKLKAKGWYGEVTLSKNPTNLICVDAVKALITDNVPLSDTIFSCKDLTRFVTCRNVKGGAEKDGVFLGKIVRWIYAKKEVGTINYMLSGNKVPSSDNARPLMDMPDTFPEDLDYDRYISEANDILFDLGYFQREQQIKFF